VQGRHVAACADELHESELAIARVAVDVDAGQIVDEPERLGRRGRERRAHGRLLSLNSVMDL